MNTKNRPRFGGFGVYAMLILLVIILWYTFTNNSTTSDFTQNNLWKAIREEQVVSIRIEQNREVPTGYLDIKMKDGSTERMYASDVNEIQKELKEKDFTQFVVDDVQSESWIMTLLPYLLIFGAIFILFMIMSMVYHRFIFRFCDRWRKSGKRLPYLRVRKRKMCSISRLVVS